MTVIEEFDYLCRLCATKTGLILLGLPIFESRNIDKKIAACIPLQVTMADKLPKVVCEECAFKLDQFFDFREKCLHTECMFNEMLKKILKDQDEELKENGSRNEGNMETLGNNLSQVQAQDVQQLSVPNTMHVLQVMDEMSLSNGEQIITENKMSRPNDVIVEVASIHLDRDTVRMVDEHIREVSNQDIALHLEATTGDLSVTVGSVSNVNTHLSQLDINYVTSMTVETQVSEDQIVRYCNEVKYDSLSSKELQDKLHLQPSTNHIIQNGVTLPENFSLAQSESKLGQALNLTDQTNGLEHSSSVSALNQPADSTDTATTIAILDEYTKSSKNALLETILNNPTMDATGANWYICPLCNEATSDSSSLPIHFERHFYCCPNCDEIFFTNLEALEIHKQDCTPLEEFFIIKQVDDTDNQINEEMEETEKKAQGSRQKWTPKICTHCGKQYRTNYKLREHMRKHTGEKPFQCSLCEKAFRSKIGLAQHTATHTGQFDYNCSTCGKGFQCKSYLVVHQRVHSDLKPYPCSTCGQNFKTKQSLLDHQNRHLGVKPYICDICGRGFITKGLCKSHQKIHSGMDNRQYPCDVCNKMFVSKSYLNTHLRIHTGEKPYLCEVCGKGFLTRVDLKIHSTMHTGEKSFKCEICSKVFARRAALRCHCRSHTGERPYRCDICGKTFTQFSPMTIHKRLHTGERPYECDICNKAFVSRSTMMCHRKKHVGNSVDTRLQRDPLQ